MGRGLLRPFLFVCRAIKATNNVSPAKKFAQEKNTSTTTLLLFSHYIIANGKNNLLNFIKI